MTAKALLDSWEDDELPQMPLGERLIYMEMRYAADKRGTIRLSQSDLAAKLGVTRQAIVKHVDSLMEKRLVSRTGHGRYTVMSAPRSLFDAAKAYRAKLKPGDEWSAWDLAAEAFGIEFAPDSTDQRLNEAMAYTETLQRAGRLHYDETTGVYTLARDS